MRTEEERLITSGECGTIKAAGVRLPARLSWVLGQRSLVGALAYNEEHGSGLPCSWVFPPGSVRALMSGGLFLAFLG